MYRLGGIPRAAVRHALVDPGIRRLEIPHNQLIWLDFNSGAVWSEAMSVFDPADVWRRPAGGRTGQAQQVAAGEFLQRLQLGGDDGRHQHLDGGLLAGPARGAGGRARVDSGVLGAGRGQVQTAASGDDGRRHRLAWGQGEGTGGVSTLQLHPRPCTSMH